MIGERLSNKILVVGATGTVGRSLLVDLCQRGAAVRAATRNPAAAIARLGGQLDVQFVSFDLEQPATFEPALAGVDRVFLISRPGDDHADSVALPLIEVMERSGVQHVVDLSAMGAEIRPEFALRKIELRLEASAAAGMMAFTHLRPNWFMQLFAGGALLAQIRGSRTLRVPAAKAKISWVDARDVAAVTAVVLTEPGHRGKAYTLTGGEALDHDEVATILSEASGEPIRYQPISEDEARRALGQAGFPPPWVERLVIFYQLVRAEYAAPASSSVLDVLGRPARKMAAFARENAAIWANREAI